MSQMLRASAADQHFMLRRHGFAILAFLLHNDDHGEEKGDDKLANTAEASVHRYIRGKVTISLGVATLSAELVASLGRPWTWLAIALEAGAVMARLGRPWPWPAIVLETGAVMASLGRPWPL